MKITSTYTYKPYKPNFGYDKKLNQELKDALASHEDKNWAQTLSSMNSYCNKLESNIVREAKKTSNDNSRMADYLDIFFSVKQMLAGFVSITFEHLNYADREFNHYYDEYVKDGSKTVDWRMGVCTAIKDWISPDLEEKMLTPEFQEADEEVVASSEENKPVEQVPDFSKVNKIAESLSPKSFLEEFKPTLSSPKGFCDVAGMYDLKRDLSEGIIQLINNPEQAQLDFEEYGKTIPKAILLYGPPGCGKTYITEALASEVNTPLYMLNISKTGSHYINMTSKNIKAAFDEAIEISKKSDKPCLIFMDEVDTMGFDRNSRMEPDDLKQVGTMLQGMDAIKDHNIIIIGATNKYNLLDPAIKRRFSSKVFVDVPDIDSIKALVTKNLTPLKKGQKLLSSDEDITTVAKMLQGYSNSSICTISKEAAMLALHRDRADISIEDYKKAIETTGEEKPDRKEYLAESKKKTNKIGF